MATVVHHQPQSYPIGQHQPAVIQLQTIHQTTTTTASPNNNSLNTGYNRKAALSTGIIQICCGSLLVLLGIAALSIGSRYRSAWNIWGGLCFYVSAGIIGVVSRKQSRCGMIAYMVMSILSAICAGGQVIYDSVAASASSCHPYSDYYYYYDYFSNMCDINKGVVAVHSMAAIVGFVEMIVGIVASAYCCCGTCNSNPTQQTVIQYAQSYPGGQVTVVTPSNYPQGPAVINPSQTYGMGLYPPPYPGHAMGQLDLPVGQATEPPAALLVGPSGTVPPHQYPLSYPAYSSYKQPVNSVPVPLDPE